MDSVSQLSRRKLGLQREHQIYGHFHTLTALTNVLKRRTDTAQHCILPAHTSIKIMDQLPRRQMSLGIASIFIAALTTPTCSSYANELTSQQLELYVAQTPSKKELAGDVNMQFTSISAALRRLEETPSSTPAVIHVAAGTYNERLVISRPNVTIQAWPQGANVAVEWRTPEPYQSVLDVTAKGVSIQRLTLQHASKSIANNYGVYIHEGSDVTLEDCDISSSTGTGIGIEAASPTIVGCRVHGCRRHGIAVFGALDPFEPPGGGLIQECDVSDNGGDGVLVSSGAEPKVDRCIIHDNKGWGISLQGDSRAELVANTVRGNGQGAVKVTASFDFDAGGLNTQNALLGKVAVK